MPATPEIAAARQPSVLDATVLSNFAIIHGIHLLEPIYRGRACTTLMVVTEIQRGIEAGYQRLRPVTDILASSRPTGWLPVLGLESAKEQASYLELSRSLGTGEASCLAWQWPSRAGSSLPPTIWLLVAEPLAKECG